jgi:uncharacterized membrane protein YqjE
MNGSGNESRSIPDLLRRLSEETATLVRQELALARVELLEKVKPVGVSVGLIGAAALFGAGAFAALTACLIAAIALVLPMWSAALIVTAIYGIVALILALRALSTLRKIEPGLPQTTETVKEDIEWAKTRLKSGVK